MFAASTSDRAYLFSRYGNSVFGLVDGPFKYIYDFNRDRAELFNLAINPSETHDLSADSAYSATKTQDRARIGAWIAFQNEYLRKFQTPSTVVADALPTRGTTIPSAVADKGSAISINADDKGYFFGLPSEQNPAASVKSLLSHEAMLLLVRKPQ